MSQRAQKSARGEEDLPVLVCMDVSDDVTRVRRALHCRISEDELSVKF